MYLKKLHKTKHLILLFVLVSSQAQAIVNMDGLHFGKNKNTFSADFDFSVSGTSGNSNTEKVALNSQLSWVSEKSINLAIFGYQYGKSNNLRNVNKAFAHYRYIYQLNDFSDIELFTQLEKNEFRRLSYRGLLGSGFRFSVFHSAKHSAFFGLGAFYSKEEIAATSGLTDNGIEELTRANIYILSKYKISPTISFSNVFYYQPQINKIFDYRALLESKFDFKINDKLSIRLSLDVEHDSAPSQTIKNTDISYMTGLKFSF